jgi:xanthine dehydrogenase YagT iron-sulfur-binding subunit
MPPNENDLTRREFVGVTAGAAGLTASIAEAAAVNGSAEGVPCSLTINGHRHDLRLEPRVTLLDLLRERLHLTGSKKGCDHGQCGACTVLVDGARVLSCLTLAITQDHRAITTIEGLSTGDVLHPIQAAFIEHDGFQCGFCTSGQICSAVAMLNEIRAGMPSAATVGPNRPEAQTLSKLPDAHALLNDEDEIRERMSGNICRCGAYPNIVAALRAAAQTTHQDTEDRAR